MKAEVLVVEEKKARTFALIESIGQEKAVVDEAVESSRADEEDAAKLQVRLKNERLGARGRIKGREMARKYALRQRNVGMKNPAVLSFSNPFQSFWLASVPPMENRP